MTSVVTFVRFLNAIHGRRTNAFASSSGGSHNFLSDHVTFPQRSTRGVSRTAAGVVVVSGVGFFLGGLDPSLFVWHETVSSVSHQVSRYLHLVRMGIQIRGHANSVSHLFLFAFVGGWVVLVGWDVDGISHPIRTLSSERFHEAWIRDIAALKNSK